MNLDFFMGKYVAQGIRDEWAKGDRLCAFVPVFLLGSTLTSAAMSAIIFIIKHI